MTENLAAGKIKSAALRSTGSPFTQLSNYRDFVNDSGREPHTFTRRSKLELLAKQEPPFIHIFGFPETTYQQNVQENADAYAEDYDKKEWQSSIALMGDLELQASLEALGISSEMRERYSKRILKGKKISVIGGGTGREALPIAMHGAKVTVVDISKPSLAILAEKARKINAWLGVDLDLSLYNSPAETFQTQEKQDAIFALFGVINHLENPLEALARITESLETGGNLFLSVYTPDALVFQLQNNELINYKHIMLQRRAKGGIILNGHADTGEVFPTQFPLIQEIVTTLNDNGCIIEDIHGFLRLSSLFPKDTKPENIEAFKTLIMHVDPTAGRLIQGLRDQDEILLTIFNYDNSRESQGKISEHPYLYFKVRKN